MCAVRSSTAEFVEKARRVHGNAYDYSQVVYVSTHTHVLIACAKGHVFSKTPNHHLRGEGCPNCRIITTETFIQRARAAHGERYIYDAVRYTRNSEKVDIICRDHGSFWQLPDIHWKGSHCPKCARIRSNTDEFIRKGAAELRAVIGGVNEF